MDRLLRLMASKALVLGADQIRSQGFGPVQRTYRRGGAIVTEAITPGFRLSCGCIVTRIDDVGRPCVDCLAELQAMLAVTPGHALSPEDLMWMASPCRSCARLCAAIPCGRSVCTRHSARHPEGHELFYCGAHFGQLVEELAREKRIERFGIVGEKARGFARSLFARREDDEPR